MNIYVLDETGTVIYANQGSADVLGVPKEKLIGSKTKDLLRNGVIDQSVSMRAFQGKEEFTIGELKTQKGHNLLIVSKVIRDENNKSYVVTNSSLDRSIDKVQSLISQERSKRQKYQSALEYYIKRDEDKFIVKSQSMRQFLERLRPALATDSTIMLYGESGVGKDIIANYIHRHSPRQHEPIIPINCASIPQTLTESEFFGYEKGAFTDASPRGKLGYFEMATNGTLFLDEIGELPLPMQAKLLRVLEDRMIMRIGGNKHIHVNLRIIAATNQNLQLMVQKKIFREDLYHRLNVLPFTIPPLRHRVEDIIPLAEYFLQEYCHKYNLSKTFSKDAYIILNTYPWPGNVRELRNVVERLCIMTMESVITGASLNQIGLHADTATAPSPRTAIKARDQRERDAEENSMPSIAAEYQTAERERVLRALVDANGNKTKAAKALGISRGRLYKLMGSL